VGPSSPECVRVVERRIVPWVVVVVTLLLRRLRLEKEGLSCSYSLSSVGGASSMGAGFVVASTGLTMFVRTQVGDLRW